MALPPSGLHVGNGFRNRRLLVHHGAFIHNQADSLASRRSASVSEIHPVLPRIDLGRILCCMWMGFIGGDIGEAYVCGLGLGIALSANFSGKIGNSDSQADGNTTWKVMDVLEH